MKAGSPPKSRSSNFAARCPLDLLSSALSVPCCLCHDPALGMVTERRYPHLIPVLTIDGSMLSHMNDFACIASAGTLFQSNTFSGIPQRRREVHSGSLLKQSKAFS